MSITCGERLAPVLALGAAAAFIPGLSEFAFGQTSPSISPVIHFRAVGMTALVTAVASPVLTGKLLRWGVDAASHERWVEALGGLLSAGRPAPAERFEHAPAPSRPIPATTW